MPEPRHWHLLLYDVSDDKVLRRVHRILKDWGRALQYSVFRVRCTARELERLRFELLQFLGDDDRRGVVRLCNGCAGRITTRGRDLAPLDLEQAPCRIV